MRMNNQMEESKRIPRQLVLAGEAGHAEKGALACDLIMLGIFVWNQIAYGIDMMFLIIPLALLAVYFVMFGLVAEEYRFAEAALEIQHRFRKTVVIPYDAVFNFEASARDSFINIVQSNKVKVYHAQGTQKKMTMCTPKDVATFVETLKWNCPEFHEEPQEKSKLEVFFGDKE